MLEKLKRWRAMAIYMFHSRLLPVMIAACTVAVLVLDGYYGFKRFDDFKELWNQSMNAYAGIATLCVALAVWWGELREDWLDNLPKKLTVRFEFNGRLVMECRLAALSGLGDRRQLEQQIGMQMTNCNKLDFAAPAISLEGGDVREDANAEHYLDYHLTFTLLKMPTPINSEVTAGTHYLLWKPPFKSVDVLPLMPWSTSSTPPS